MTFPNQWFGASGDRILQVLRVVKRRYVLLVYEGSMPEMRLSRMDATETRSGFPCQDSPNGWKNLFCSTAGTSCSNRRRISSINTISILS